MVNQQNAGLGTMETDQILDLFNLGIEGSTDPASSAAGVGGTGGEEDVLDVNGEVREKGKKGLMDGLGELWDERGYEEEYNLDSFLASMKS